jgi:hypothetical protein
MKQSAPLERGRPGFALRVQCEECPWRTDVAPGRFSPERYQALAETCLQGLPWRPIFACHKTGEGREQACVGYLLRNGANNFVVRLAANSRKFDPQALRATGPLYDGFRAMAIANGWDPGDHPDFQ